MKAIYINGMGAISPQKTWGNQESILSEPTDFSGARLSCIEPDYSQFIEIKNLRRMSRILKMGMVASAMALQEAGVKIPDGIITGTGYGCLEDTGVFLQKMVEQKEIALSPTPFIQSTHNTIGSLIALQLKCQGYNQTYTQDGLSFENALLDAMLALNENPDQMLLTGGADEITDVSHEIQKRFRLFRKASTASLKLFKSPNHGTLQGEGVVYFALSGKKGNETCAMIDSVATFFDSSQEELISGINQFLQSAAMKSEELDLVLLGKSGNQRADAKTDKISKASFGSVPIGYFKHLCGEYPTASAFALWLGARIIQTQTLPAIVLNESIKRPFRNILIYNPYFGQTHSLILLRAC